MTIDNELLKTIRGDLGIPVDFDEAPEIWMCRTVYSVLGHTALVSLWDKEELQELISITHLKRRIEKNFYAYEALYPEIRTIFSVDSEALENEIYDLYSSMGYLYHMPQRVKPVVYSACRNRNISLVRGASPGMKVQMSGLGLYTVEDAAINTDAVKMFGLSKHTIADSWKILVSSANWVNSTIQQDVEYLITKPPFNKGYWKNIPDANGEISLLRTGYAEGRIYYLYFYRDGECWISQIPDWLTSGYNYRYVSNWLLAEKNILPPIEYKEHGDLISINIKYLLPPRELSLLKLYSWPRSFGKLPSDFSRECAKKVFPALKELLETIGYKFKEVK